MATTTNIVTESTTLSPLTEFPTLRRGLIAVTFLGFLSFVTSVSLFIHLTLRLVKWTRQPSGSLRVNQFMVLLANLIFADIQQSIAFLLNMRWINENAIIVETSTCWAQGWFVSTGDLASGLFTFAIAIHAFMDIVFNYRLGQRMFAVAIVSLWMVNYACAVSGIGLHPDNFYVRAGAWCWVNFSYVDERLWLHYFWIIIAEFGTVVLYAVMWLIIRRRVKESFYTDSKTALRARSAAKTIIVYPIVYVVCTLPLVKARLTGMANQNVSFLELTVAACMITSNGWLDVLLYALTRRGVFFGTDDPDSEGGVFDTFRLRPDQAYGTTTHIEANRLNHASIRRNNSRQGSHTPTGSTEELFTSAQMQGVKTEHSDIMELDRIPRGHGCQDGLSKEIDSFDSRSGLSRKQ